jgi:hypothetical protein
VSDLGNLIRLYSEWHTHLLPYYSFDHFVHKVQQVASTKRVKVLHCSIHFFCFCKAFFLVAIVNL